jgi:hypothetical protein
MGRRILETAIFTQFLLTTARRDSSTLDNEVRRDGNMISGSEIKDPFFVRTPVYIPVHDTIRLAGVRM